MKIRIRNTKLTLWIISGLQIIGGFTGLSLVFGIMLNTGEINGPILLIFLAGLLLFVYSIYSGGRLLSDRDKRTGIILSIINQVLQLAQVSIFGYGLIYSSGGEITLGIENQKFKFDIIALVSRFSMTINSGNEVVLKINLLAIVILIVLVDIWRELISVRFSLHRVFGKE